MTKDDSVDLTVSSGTTALFTEAEERSQVQLAMTFSFQIKKLGERPRKKNQDMSATETKIRPVGKAFHRGAVSTGTQQVWSSASGRKPSE